MNATFQIQSLANPEVFSVVRGGVHENFSEALAAAIDGLAKLNLTGSQLRNANIEVRVGGCDADGRVTVPKVIVFRLDDFRQAVEA